MEQTKNNILWSKVNRAILLYLNNKEDYASNIAKAGIVGLHNTSPRIKLLREYELIEQTEIKGGHPKKSDKKAKYYKLTEKGKRIVELLLELNEKLEDKTEDGK